jgi:hypothetical protein
MAKHNDGEMVVATTFAPKGSPKGTPGDPIVYRLGTGNYVFVLKNSVPQRKGPKNWALGVATDSEGTDLEVVETTFRSGMNQPLMTALQMAESVINDLEEIVDADEVKTTAKPKASKPKAEAKPAKLIKAAAVKAA